MDESRQEPESARDRARGADRQSSRPQRAETAEHRDPEWLYADQPDGWRHSDEPPLTDTERHERWPLG